MNGSSHNVFYFDSTSVCLVYISELYASLDACAQCTLMLLVTYL